MFITLCTRIIRLQCLVIARYLFTKILNNMTKKDTPKYTN